MTEYLITIRVRTNRQPRDDPWPQLAKAADALFKVRPTGELDMLGASIEQVTSIRDKATPKAGP